ncbi:hypothetical protein JCM10213_005752 [Rhodosporidiobolus nylandii]
MSSAPSLPIHTLPASDVLEDSHPFDPLLSLESGFYQRGYDGGFPHGELHGLFEGRELGREKAWELWEEIGYAEGTARVWKKLLEKNGVEGGRANGNLDALLSLAASFPTSNDSSSLSSAPPPSSPTLAVPPPDDAAPSQAPDVDIPALLSALRSKYRTACAGLGVRPRMAVAGGQDAKMTQANGDGMEGVREASLRV